MTDTMELYIVTQGHGHMKNKKSSKSIFSKMLLSIWMKFCLLPHVGLLKLMLNYFVQVMVMRENPADVIYKI